MLLPTNFPSIGLLILRLVVGVIFIVHGFPKIMGGRAMAKGMGKPSWGSFMIFIGLAEFLGGIAVAIGFLTQIAAIGLALIMIGAIKMKFGWKVAFTYPDKAGWEYDFVLLAAALCLLFLGGGAISVDALLGW